MSLLAPPAPTPTPNLIPERCPAWDPSGNRVTGTRCIFDTGHDELHRDSFGDLFEDPTPEDAA